MSHNPVGRERALEALMDRDPWGSYYRAVRVVEESAPTAWNSRPHFISPSTLTELAFSLPKPSTSTTSSGSSSPETPTAANTILTNSSSSEPTDPVVSDTAATARTAQLLAAQLGAVDASTATPLEQAQQTLYQLVLTVASPETATTSTTTIWDCLVSLFSVVQQQQQDNSNTTHPITLPVACWLACLFPESHEWAYFVQAWTAVPSLQEALEHICSASSSSSSTASIQQQQQPPPLTSRRRGSIGSSSNSDDSDVPEDFPQLDDNDDGDEPNERLEDDSSSSSSSDDSTAAAAASLALPLPPPGWSKAALDPHNATQFGHVPLNRVVHELWTFALQQPQSAADGWVDVLLLIQPMYVQTWHEYQNLHQQVMGQPGSMPVAAATATLLPAASTNTTDVVDPWNDDLPPPLGIPPEEEEEEVSLPEPDARDSMDSTDHDEEDDHDEDDQVNHDQESDDTNQVLPVTAALIPDADNEHILDSNNTGSSISDDPITCAFLNTVPSAEESLELKGMHRKAAAAAFEARKKELAALQATLELWRTSLQFALQWLRQQAAKNSIPQSQEMQQALQSLMQHEDENKDNLRVLETWGECLLAFYPTPEKLMELLQQELAVADSKKLPVICQQLMQHWEVLCSKPIPYDDKSTAPTEQTPARPSAMLRRLRSSTNPHAQKLYWTLGKACHARILLWDGLYHDTNDGPSADGTVSLQSPLPWDATKCADSIAIASSPSVQQRASKVWGTVLLQQGFHPQTGVHRWAVRLDQCERGHVFFGVATAQASMRTYVGGDKYGWGLIGTQALWHDRRKIRGDYGGTLRSGATVIVTLDTDAGTLSYGLWKDGTSSSSLAVDPLAQNVVSPSKNTGAVPGTVEDWGVAFEGLPLDSRLYPAIGLYQRDDRVTILSIAESSGRNSSESATGECYYPRMDQAEIARHVREHNDALSMDGIQYAAETLQSGNMDPLLPSLAASLCLVPASVPVLSTRLAVILLPHVRRCVQRLMKLVEQKDEQQLHPGMIDGKWTIRATGPSDIEEYIVDVENRDNGFKGSGVGTSGKSKDGTVSLIGTMNGTSLIFLEEWSDEGSKDSASACVVTARLSLDGRRFDGTYRNVKYGTTGQIVGQISEENSLDVQPSKQVTMCLSLLCMAQSHLASLIGDAVDFQSTAASGPCNEISETKREQLRQLFDLAILTNASTGDVSPEEMLAATRTLYQPAGSEDSLCDISYDDLLKSKYFTDTVSARGSRHCGLSLEQLETMVKEIDEKVAPLHGGMGSLRPLCPDLYSSTRRRIILSALHMNNMIPEFSELFPLDGDELCITNDMSTIWRSSLQIIEDGVRNAIAEIDASGSTKQQRALLLCRRYSETGAFLIGLDFEREYIAPRRRVLFEDISRIYTTIGCSEEISHLKTQMELSTKRALLRSVAMDEIKNTLSSCQMANSIAMEYLFLGIPHHLGRGCSIPAGDSDGFEPRSFSSAPDLDGDCLSGLAGASFCVKKQLQSTVLSLFEQAGRILGAAAERANEQKGSGDCSVGSILLSALPLFAGQVSNGMFEDIVGSSGILRSLPKVVSLYRKRISEEWSCAAGSKGDDEMIEELHWVYRRDLALMVIRCCTSVSHSLLYQAALLSTRPVAMKFSPDFVNLLMSEMSGLFPTVEQLSRSTLAAVIKQRVDGDIKLWHDSIRQGTPNSSVKPQKKEVDILAIDFVRAFGTQGKPTVNRKLYSGILNQPNNAFRSSSLHDLLTQWLHIQCSLFRSPEALRVVLKETKWLSILLRVVGISSEEDNNGIICATALRSQTDGIVPARFRARVVRQLLPLLLAMDPNKSIVEGLFELAGVTSSLVTRSIDEEENTVSVESVSLVRHLHAPIHPEWRSCINEVITLITGAKTSNPFCKKVGVLSFFAGTFGGICRGSFVVLKPANAAALSPEQTSPSSSKSHSSGLGGSAGSQGIGASPHHLVGNGTEAIISGLCSGEASAGVVSSIDTKNGLCEVILLPRGHDSGNDGGNNENADRPLIKRSGGRKASGARQALTVRALRTPLVDTFLAQEVPLYLDESVPLDSLVGTMLQEALSSLLSAVTPDLSKDKKIPAGSCSDDNEQLNESAGTSLTAEESSSVRSGVLGLSSDILVIRCCIVALSESKTLERFMKDGENRVVLKDLLSLSWPEPLASASNSAFVREVRNKSLSSLSLHETRLGYLTTLIHDVSFRQQVLGYLSDEDWTEKLNERLPRPKAGELNTSETPDAAGDSSRVQSRTRAGRASKEDERGNEMSYSRSISQSTGGSNSDDEEDEEESEGTSTAVAHLREAAIAQMAELGLPRSWSELALRRVGGLNIEAAVSFCLECGEEMERLLAEDRERERMQSSGGSGAGSGRGTSETGTSSHLLRQLTEMGFPRRWCVEALAVSGNNVDEALTWILSNGERLSEEDEAIGAEDDADIEDDDDDDEDDDEDESGEDDEGDGEETLSGGAGKEPSTQRANIGELGSSYEKPPNRGWTGSVTPLRFISGRSIIDAKSLEISGLPNGGFSSVGTKGVLLTTGKWYYEAILESAGCLQIGWADGGFAGHCHAERGDGCGDGPSSWAFDGWRRYRWHSTATEWGCRWKEGDIVGCMVDLDERVVSFTLNGEGERIGMGVAFSGEGFRPCGGVYACVSFNRREKLRLILGGENNEPFKHSPPLGYRGVGEAVLEAVKERAAVVKKECVLGPDSSKIGKAPAFLCDFSDGEHGHELMAWGHRYYGADASVHLGTGGTKQSSTRSSPSGSGRESPSIYVSRRLAKIWSEIRSSEANESHKNVKDFIKNGYEEAEKSIAFDVFNECLVVAVLLARKLILHGAFGMGSSFEPSAFVVNNDDNVGTMCKLWKTIDACSSLRSVGWAGEASAMAIAAETLGLGISSNDLTQNKSPSDRPGLVSCQDLDQGLVLPVSSNTQLLNSVLARTDTNCDGSDISARLSTAEVPLCSGGGGAVTTFLLESLRSAVKKSTAFRSVLLAAVRRSVRLLAAVEYEGDDSNQGDTSEDDENCSRPSTKRDSETTKRALDVVLPHHPDARLAAFVSGLLLSSTKDASHTIAASVQADLAEAWSIGLLSASLPWRMVCAFTTAGIVETNPRVFEQIVGQCATMARYFGRLPSTVARRVWAERAAVPVCSRYTQAMVELLTSAKKSVRLCSSLPEEFLKYWESFQVDAATPLPLDSSVDLASSLPSPCWQSSEGWISSDCDWIVWIGTAEYERVEWNPPIRSSVPALMDGGDGPPMLDVGCTVLRSIDWNKTGSGAKDANEDGKDIYDSEKAIRDEEKRKARESGVPQGAERRDTHSVELDCDPVEDGTQSVNPAEPSDGELSGTEVGPEADAIEQEKPEDRNIKKKRPSPKLATGTVIGIESWDGVHGLARRIRWNLTGTEGIYRFGGDGGKFDICHVETNKKGTRVKKRYPLPETAEQCASRHGFGRKRSFAVLLRLKKNTTSIGEGQSQMGGILEWPDFGAGIRVSCSFSDDGSVKIKEEQLLFGSKDSGWEIRFGQPSFVAGTEYTLTPTDTAESESLPDSPIYEQLSGSSTFCVKSLRNPGSGGKLQVLSRLTFSRGKQRKEANTPEVVTPPFIFDSNYHAESLSLSRDGRTVSCVACEGRGSAFASVGFSKGVHYWEVKLEQADIGSVFIGVAEKPNGSGSGSSFGFDTPPRLNRWHGWGFVNFRATYTSGAERVYGAHCHAGDTVGVLLDCDAGRLSFFFDGLKYGEHILNDLGCAFEHLSPFGFNVDGCGSGGAGQGAPNGFDGGRGGRYPSQGAVRPRALFPVIGLRNQGDRVTISSKWNTSYGVDGIQQVRNILSVDELLNYYSLTGSPDTPALPDWFLTESLAEYRRWNDDSCLRCVSRGSGPYKLSSYGLDLLVDASPLACAAATASLGLEVALLAGDRIRLLRSAGRILELAEEAVVLGSYGGRLYYQLVSQKSEGGSLTEGGGRAWCLDESEVVDGLPFVHPGQGRGIPLPKLSRFVFSAGGLKVVHEEGAVLRSDIEINDMSLILGTISVNTVLSCGQVLERRANSCGVIRYRVAYEDIGEGWISSRIRGLQEEPIVEELPEKDAADSCSDAASDRANEDAEGVAQGEKVNPSVSTVADTADDAPEQELFSTPQQCAAAWYDKWKVLNSSTQEISTMKIEDVANFKKLVYAGKIPGLSTLESDSLLSAVVTAISNCSESGNGLDCSFQSTSSALASAISTVGKTQLSTFGSPRPASQQAVAAIFSNVSLGPNFPELKALMARIAVLRAFNRRARLALPWLSMRPCQEGSAILGGLCGHGTSIARAGRSRLGGQDNNWIQVVGMGNKIRSVRGIFFSSVKREFLQSVADATTTPTPLSHDEYELPREIRTVRVNRLKATRAMQSDDTRAKRKFSVFAQLQSETKSWGGAALRRGYVAKGHGGQKRAFRVKLIGEGVNDYSGPYREVFTDAVGETLKTLSDGRGGALGVLDPTPNNSSSIGEDRDLFMFSLNGRDLNPSPPRFVDKDLVDIYRSFSFLTLPRDETAREVEDALVFLGRIVATAYRHGIAVDLPLPLQAVWKAFTEEDVSSREQLAELDVLASRQADEDHLHASPLLLWQQRMLNAFTEGLSSVLPVEILPLLSGEELRQTICGNPEVDVELLQRVVEYEGYKPADAVVGFFWETLREMSNNERKQFLRFVWARNRLPLRESDFEGPFKITKDTINEGDKADKVLPSASTCFFSLTLPEYSSKALLQEKLLFAIANVTTMETDFQTNSAEIAEGYRTF